MRVELQIEKMKRLEKSKRKISVLHGAYGQAKA